MSKIISISFPDETVKKINLASDVNSFGGKVKELVNKGIKATLSEVEDENSK